MQTETGRTSRTLVPALNRGDMLRSPAVIRITAEHIPGHCRLKIDSTLLTTSDCLWGWWDVCCRPSRSRASTAAGTKYETITITSIIINVVIKDPKAITVIHLQSTLEIIKGKWQSLSRPGWANQLWVRPHNIISTVFNSFLLSGQFFS